MRSFQILIALAVVLTIAVPGQAARIVLYRTFADVENKAGEVIEHMHLKTYKGQKNSTLILQDDADKEIKREVACSELWGFTYDSLLYRIVKPGQFYEESKPHDFPARLVYAGGIFYFENGLNHLMSYAHNWTTYELPDSYVGYMSATIDGDMVLVPGIKAPGWVKDQGMAFLHKHPEYASIETCLNNCEDKPCYRTGNVIICIRQFLGLPPSQH